MVELIIYGSRVVKAINMPSVPLSLITITEHLPDWQLIVENILPFRIFLE